VKFKNLVTLWAGICLSAAALLASAPAKTYTPEQIAAESKRANDQGKIG
jgi:hypothetical protein